MNTIVINNPLKSRVLLIPSALAPRCLNWARKRVLILQEETALARPRRSVPGWGTEAIVCLWAWLVMAGCVVGLTLHAASGHIARTDLRLLHASHRLPASIEPWV